METILTSLHGRRFGLSKNNRLVLNGGSAGEGAQAVIDGITVTTITSAQLLALNATEQPIVAALGAGKAALLRRVTITKPAGTAYAGIAAGEDLAVKITDDSGATVATVETTGFLDQTTEQTRVAYGVSNYAPVANAALVLHLLTGEITTGDSDLIVEARYEVVDIPVIA